MKKLPFLFSIIAAVFVGACATRDDSASVGAQSTAATEYMWVGGEVAQPGPKVWSDGMTLRKAIESAGGFAETANKSRLRVIHPDGSTQMFAFADTEAKNDPFLKPGDKVFVGK